MSGDGHLHPRHGDLRRLAGPRPRRRRRDGARAAPPGQPCPGHTTCCPTASSTRAPPGRRRWRAAHHGLGNLTALVDINALQADGPTAGVLRTEPVLDKWAAFGWHVRGSTATTSTRWSTPSTRRRRSTDGQPAVVICDTRIGCGVPLLETREKAHFMRVDEHEWQIAREQLAAATGRTTPMTTTNHHDQPHRAEARRPRR